MRLLHVIASMDPKSGGPCQGIRNMDTEIKKFGVDREIACVDLPNAEYLGMDKFKIHALGSKPNPWAHSPLLKPWLLNNLHRFDAVILNGLWLYPGFALYQALNEIKKENPIVSPKFFIMPHGMLDPYFQKAPERKLKAIRNEIYWRFIENKLVKRADAVLFTCEEELLLARQSFKGYAPKAEINVGYGVEKPPVFQPKMKEALLEKCPALANEKYILFLSRIHQKKGIDLLIEAYMEHYKLNKNIPKLVIAGPGLEEQYAIDLIEKTKRAGHYNVNIFFPGMLSHDYKWGALYCCEAFILPSHQENFGIAIVEALACCKPVLITDKVNIWREIKEKNCGLVEEDTLKGTSTMLGKFLSLSTAELETMGKNAYDCYLSFFTNTSFVNNLINNIKKIVDKSKQN